MEYRRLGRSGLTISEIAYGNWLTHGSQVEEDAAHACVRAALDAGITTFDTADVYAGTRAESVLGWLVVEGCGSCPRAADPWAVLRIWVEAPPEVRLARGLA